MKFGAEEVGISNVYVSLHERGGAQKLGVDLSVNNSHPRCCALSIKRACNGSNSPAHPRAVLENMEQQ